MTPQIQRPSIYARLGSGLLCTFGLTVLGLSAGALLGGRVFGGGGMGWDQLADALGGAAIGIVSGLVLSVWAIRQLPVLKQVWLGLGAGAVAACAIAVIQLLKP